MTKRHLHLDGWEGSCPLCDAGVLLVPYPLSTAAQIREWAVTVAGYGISPSEMRAAAVKKAAADYLVPERRVPNTVTKWYMSVLKEVVLGSMYGMDFASHRQSFSPRHLETPLLLGADHGGRVDQSVLYQVYVSPLQCEESEVQRPAYVVGGVEVQGRPRYTARERPAYRQLDRRNKY